MIGAALKQMFPQAEFEVNEETGKIIKWKPGAIPTAAQIQAALSQYDPPVSIEDFLDAVATVLNNPGAPEPIKNRARQAARRAAQ